MGKRLINEEFIEKARKVHGDKYDYSKIEYINNRTNVVIICPIHGEFTQIPHNHLKGSGCPLCARNKKYNSVSFIEKAKQVHGDKYDYSKVEYVYSQTKICIICPIHGEFWQIPNDHLRGKGCFECGNIVKGKFKKSNTNDFIQKSKKIHGDKYDYSKVNYINSQTKVCIICPIHGEFWITPHNHTISKNPQGCKECGIITRSKKNTMSFEEFKEKAILKHGEKYEYVDNKILDDRTINIKCKKCNYVFCIPISSHLCGRGCPCCNFSKLETKMEIFLKENNIEYIPQFSIKNRQKIDFYLPQYNIAIECQGNQHFELSGWSKNKEKQELEFEKIKKRDKQKFNYCQENGINIIYFLRREYNNKAINLDIGIYNEKNIINNTENILEFIKKNEN